MIDFGRGRRAHLAVLHEGEPIAPVLDAFGISPGIPVVVLVGGAANMESDVTERARVVMRDVVVPVCDEVGAAVVDGGTAAGVMEVIGLEHTTCHATFPLIGVASVGTVSLPGDVGASPERADLDVHHSHFVLVPGTQWGDESRWIIAVARAIAADAAIVGLVLGGGDITTRDVRLIADAGALLVTVAGTGGVADELASAQARGTASSNVVAIPWDAREQFRRVLRNAMTS